MSAIFVHLMTPQAPQLTVETVTKATLPTQRAKTVQHHPHPGLRLMRYLMDRSEERRVGKEC